MIEYFGSAYFLGILLQSLSCVAFLIVFFPSWFGGRPRRFLVARLTYVNDKEQQSVVRFMWLLAWLTALVGSFVSAYNHSQIPHTFGWIFGQTVYGVVLSWLLAKAILALCIVLQYIWFGLVRIKEWICNDKSLFKIRRL